MNLKEITEPYKEAGKWLVLVPQVVVWALILALIIRIDSIAVLFNLIKGNVSWLAIVSVVFSLISYLYSVAILKHLESQGLESNKIEFSEVFKNTMTLAKRYFIPLIGFFILILLGLFILTLLVSLIFSRAGVNLGLQRESQIGALIFYLIAPLFCFSSVFIAKENCTLMEGLKKSFAFAKKHWQFSYTLLIYYLIVWATGHFYQGKPVYAITISLVGTVWYVLSNVAIWRYYQKQGLKV